MQTDSQAAFRALADPTRRQILMHLAEGEMTIGALVNEFAMTRAAVRKHLSILQQGRLVSVRASGRERINSLEPAGLNELRNWLDYFDRYWDDKLERLASVIEAESASGAPEDD